MAVVNHLDVYNQCLLINMSLGERFHKGWLTPSCKSALQQLLHCTHMHQHTHTHMQSAVT